MVGVEGPVENGANGPEQSETIELTDKANLSLITLLRLVDSEKISFYAPEGKVDIGQLPGCVAFLKNQTMRVEEGSKWIKNFVILRNELSKMWTDDTREDMRELYREIADYVQGSQLSLAFFKARDQLKNEGFTDNEIY